MFVRRKVRWIPLVAALTTYTTAGGAQQLSGDPTVVDTALAGPTLAGPTLAGATAGVRMPMLSSDTTRRRPRAVEYSDWYMRRATIHRVASWTTLPLFAAEIVTGQELFKNGPQAAEWAQDSHGVIAGSLAGLFAVNTVTGVWNLWAAREDENGRTWRTVHAVLMLAADAGFAYTGSLAEDAENSSTVRSRHRTAAITSSSIALASYLMMLPPLRRD
jgi:hypothetical protein